MELSSCPEEIIWECDMSWDFVPRDSGHDLRHDIPRNLSGPISIRNSEATRGKPILERSEY